MNDNIKILSGHQPTYLPWLGLFHKASLADIWIFEDFTQYQVKDWYNRNYIKTPNGKIFLTVPVDLREGSIIPIKDVKISSGVNWAEDHWKKIKFNYSKAKYFKDYAGFFEEIYLNKKWNYLVDISRNMLDFFFSVFQINVDFKVGSEQNYQHKKSDLNLEMCLKHNAQICVFGANGSDYVIKEDFEKHNVKFYFQNYNHPVYPQRYGEFISHLSVIDLLFNCGQDSKNIILSGNVSKKEIFQNFAE